jgi:mono/diheme cytochrome c family protein
VPSLISAALRRALRLAASAAAALTLALPATRAEVATPLPESDGRTIYEQTCAACHGANGRGDGPAAAAFPVAPADFTACPFNSREPDADWVAIVSQGGPIRGFSELMPPHAQVLSETEIEAVVAHLRGFCRDLRWPRGELNLPRPLFTEKAYPEDEAVVTIDANVEDPGRIDTELLFEKRIGRRGQWELAVPIVIAESPDTDDVWYGGLGDIALGGKYAFYADLERGSIASLGGEFKLPTGDQAKGLGGGTTVFEPYLAIGQILPGSTFLQLQALAEIPFEESADAEAKLLATVGGSFTPSRWGRTWSPMLEVIGTWKFDGPVELDWDLVPQVQVTLSRRKHVRFNVGARIPVDDAARRPTRVVAYLLWDWFDGGLFDGW